MLGYCGYCHDAATMYCKNKKCYGARKEVCKSCAMTNNCRCSECGKKFVDEG